MSLLSSRNANALLTNQGIRAAILTPQGSKTFVKKMIPVTVAYILHQRTNFDRRNFDTHTYNGILYKRFKKKPQNPTLQEVGDWIKGAFDAFDKNYLRELYLIFCDRKDPTVIHESYKMQFKYMGDDVIPLGLPPTKQELANSTDDLLTRIASLDSLASLNENDFTLKMALTYYEDVTPAGYEPPYYGHKDDNAVNIMESLSGHSQHYYQLGLCTTGFHIVKCRAKGDLFALERPMSSLSDLNVDSLVPMESSDKTNDAAIVTKDPIDDVIELEDDDTPLEDANKTEAISGQKIEIRCVCKSTLQYKHIDLVVCSQCSYYQHSACMSYLHSADVPDKYICQTCEIGISLNSDELMRKEKLSSFRLAVAYAYLANEIPDEVLNQFPHEKKIWVSQKLRQLRIVSKTDGKLSVNMKFIQSTSLKGIFKEKIDKKIKLPDSINLIDDDDDDGESVPVNNNSNAKKRKYV